MARPLNAYVTAHKADPRYAAAFLVEVERIVPGGASVFYRFTAHTSPLTYTGGTAANTPVTGAVFAKQSFTLATLTTDQNGLAAMEVTFDDENGTMKALGLLYDFLDYPMRIWEAWLGADNAILDVYPLIYGRCDGMEAQDSEKASTVVIVCEPDDNSMQTIGPGQEYEPQCAFIYKGPECQATSGLTACDHSFPACVARGNQARFGGNRFALAAGTVLTFTVVAGGDMLNSRTYPTIDERPGY